MSGSVLANWISVSNQSPCSFCTSESKQFALVHKQSVSFIPHAETLSVFYSPICPAVIIYSSDYGGCVCTTRKRYIYLYFFSFFLFASSTTFDQVLFMPSFISCDFALIILLMIFLSCNTTSRLVTFYMNKTGVFKNFPPGSEYLSCSRVGKK